MIPYVCLYADTLTVHHSHDFFDHEVLPIDLPHKNIIWRKLVVVHPPFDHRTEHEAGTTQEVTDTDCIITYVIEPNVPVPPETPEQRQSRTLRVVQAEFFSNEKFLLTTFIFALYNEVLTLKGLPTIEIEEFKKVLQTYVA
jgi:hypothetical protein